MVVLRTIIAFLSLTLSVQAQSTSRDSLTAHTVKVFKQDKSFIDVGILWAVNEDHILLLPKSQYYKWINSSLSDEHLTFTQVPASNLKRLKLAPENKKRKSLLTGLGIGVAVGIPIGIIRQINYDEDYCENGDDPLWTECRGGQKRIKNNILTFGALGGLIGLMQGSVSLKINLPKGAESYQTQKDKIKKYSMFP